MTFDDLHLMQQIYLVREYVEKGMKLIRPTGCEYHVDEAHGVTINKSHLRTQIKHVWLPNLIDEDMDEEIFITFEVSDTKGVDYVNVNFNTHGSNGRDRVLYDQFGLTYDLHITGSLEAGLIKILCMLDPFVELEQLSASTTSVIETMLDTIPLIRTLPDSFFDDIIVDVGSMIALNRLYNAIHYETVMDKKIYRRYAPIITSNSIQELTIYSERENTATMTITMALHGPEVNVVLNSSIGKIEGGIFSLPTAYRDVAEINNNIRQMIIQIVDDCSFKEELTANLRRFLQYYDVASKRVKWGLIL
jgi:hypothetical protein